MKKYLALFLSLVLCLSATVYADDIDMEPVDTDSPSYEDSGGEASDLEPEPEPTPEPVPEPEPDPEPPAEEPSEEDAPFPDGDEPGIEAPPPEGEAPPFLEEDPLPDVDGVDGLPSNPPPVSDSGPVDAAPADPLSPEPSEKPSSDSSSSGSSGDSGSSGALPPVYAVPDDSLVPDVLDVPVSAPESHNVVTITTIPEFALAALESDSGSTLVQAVRNLFGTYTPRVQTVTTYVDGEITAVEEQYVPGVAGMDWEWIAGTALFALVLWSLFKLLGVLFKNV